jgi:hypothetical protein
MSRQHQRAVALLLLHHQHMVGGVPTVPPAIFSEACVPLPWYRRVWAWLRDQYRLVGWEALDP